MIFSITPHARRRIKERTNFKDKSLTIVKRAYYKGLPLSKIDDEGLYNKLCKIEGDRLLRVYGDFVFIFDFHPKERNKLVLITLLFLPKAYRGKVFY